MTKQKSFLKYLKKIITTHFDAGGARLPRTKLFLSSLSLQYKILIFNRGVLAKMKGQQSMSFFIYCHLMNF